MAGLKSNRYRKAGGSAKKKHVRLLGGKTEDEEAVMAYGKHNWQILVKHAACLHMPDRFNLGAQSVTRHGASGSLLLTHNLFGNTFGN